MDFDKLILRFIVRGKKTRIPNTVSKEKNKAGRFTLHDFKTYYKAKIIKTVWRWQKNRQIKGIK